MEDFYGSLVLKSLVEDFYGSLVLKSLVEDFSVKQIQCSNILMSFEVSY